jgi:sugar phosphate isomerase/epimerase
MTLAFSTLGCPEWDVETIVAEAARSGYTGIEWRGYRSVLDLPEAEPFLGDNRSRTRRALEEAGLVSCALGSSGVVGKGNVEHVVGYCALASDLGCPYVRIFGGQPESFSQAVRTAREMADIAKDHGVALVLETHDDFSTGAHVGRLLSEADHPALFALWDLHHPYRQGESPEETLAALGPWLRHVHVKDGTVEKGYTLLGEGDVPIEQMLGLLDTFGYDGYLSVEWERRWHPELPAPEVALPQYAEMLRAYRESTLSSGT